MQGADEPGARPPRRRESVRRSASETLRGLATIAYALQETGCSLHKFGRLYVDTGSADSSGLEKRWASGRVVPTRASIQKLESRLPKIRLMPIFSHLLFDVLQDRPQSENGLATMYRRLFAGFDSGNNVPQSRNVWEATSHSFYGLTPGELDQSLVLEFFTGLLVHMRLIEHEDEPGEHAIWSKYVYDLLPYAASVTFLYPHQRLLAHCVRRLHERSPISYQLCRIDWRLLFERTHRVFQLRIAGAGRKQMRAFRKSDNLSAVSMNIGARYAAHEPDDVSPEWFVEKRWWSGGPTERSVRRHREG